MEEFKNLQETKLTSQPIFDGDVLHIYKDTVRLPNGKTSTREYTVHHGAVCILPLLENGDVLLERQFRYAMGEVLTEIPAGKLDYIGEDPREAALRELREETGVEPAGRDGVEFDHVGQFYSSEGMTDELANIMVLHLHAWHPVERHFDGDEHVESAWVSWQRLRGTRITASNSMIAILHEQIRRNRQNTGKSSFES